MDSVHSRKPSPYKGLALNDRPIRITALPCTPDAEAWNNLMLAVQPALAEPIRIRIQPEAYVKWHGVVVFKRLQQTAVVAEVSTVEQAQAVIDIVRETLKSLNGKFIAVQPRPTVSDSE